MFSHSEHTDDIEDDHKRLHLCVPGTIQSSSYYAEYDNASPFFNCSIDCSIGQTSFSSFSLSQDCSTSYCTCHGVGLCRFCGPVNTSTSISVGPFSLRISSTIRRRGMRGFNRDDQKLASLRGIVKTPRFYRTTKVRNLNETLLYSLNRSSPTPCPSPTRCHFSRVSRFLKQERGLKYESKYPSKIPISSAIASLLNLDQERTSAEELQKAVDEFNAMNIGQFASEKAADSRPKLLELTGTEASASLMPNTSNGYEDELCSRIHDLPLKETAQEASTDLNAVNSLLQHLETFSVKDSTSLL